MATRDRLHKLIDELPDTPEAARRIEAAWQALEPIDEHEMAPLPAGWDRMANGQPMPNVVAAVHRSREGR
ncbi:MAG: hypothetical protein ACYCXW_10550 [Solirubrobacteraceae bacterium]